MRWGRGRRPPGADAQILDEAFLGRLERHVGPAVLRELLADGLIELTDRLERLAQAVDDGHREEVFRIGHDIAGLAGHIGLSALSAHAVAMNRAARAEPDRAVATVAAPVIAAGPSAVDALRARLDAR